MSTTVNFDVPNPTAVSLETLNNGDTFFFPETGVYYMKLARESVFRITGNQSYKAMSMTTMSANTTVVPTECDIKLKKVTWQ